MQPSDPSIEEGPFADSALFVLSPHADDAAFSVGYLLTQRRSNAPTTIAIVHPRCDHVDGFDRNLEHATTIRPAEDQAFAREASCHLVIVDARARLGIGGLNSLFDQIHLSDAQLVGNRDATMDLTGNETASLAPAGVGGHIDHLTVADAGRRLVRREMRVLHYVDQPYLALSGEPPRGPTYWKARPTLTIRARKIQLAALHPSQPAASAFTADLASNGDDVPQKW